MAPAGDSGERKSVSERVPDWFAKLVIACMGTIGAGLGAWALLSTWAHEGRIIRLETQTENCNQVLREIKDDLKEIKAAILRRP